MPNNQTKLFGKLKVFVQTVGIKYQKLQSQHSSSNNQRNFSKSCDDKASKSI